jgi:hypothetical protein
MLLQPDVLYVRYQWGPAKNKADYFNKLYTGKKSPLNPSEINMAEHSKNKLLLPRLRYVEKYIK